MENKNPKTPIKTRLLNLWNLCRFFVIMSLWLAGLAGILYLVTLNPVLATWIAGAVALYVIGAAAGLFVNRHSIQEANAYRREGLIPVRGTFKKKAAATESGFTLIELMIVIALLFPLGWAVMHFPVIAMWAGAAAVVIVGGYMTSRQTARTDEQVVTELRAKGIRPVRGAVAPLDDTAEPLDHQPEPLDDAAEPLNDRPEPLDEKPPKPSAGIRKHQLRKPKAPAPTGDLETA